jgi:hypothetical protein
MNWADLCGMALIKSCYFALIGYTVMECPKGYYSRFPNSPIGVGYWRGIPEIDTWSLYIPYLNNRITRGCCLFTTLYSVHGEYDW